MASSTLTQDRRRHMPLHIEHVQKEVASELSIEILPRGYVRWSGTWAQLEAEDLIPPGLTWPKADGATWTAGDREYVLRRRRPRHVSPSAWRAGERDYWELQCVRLIPGALGYADQVRMHTLAEALAHEEWLRSVAARVQAERMSLAVQDGHFQDLLARIGAKSGKAVRRAEIGPSASRRSR